jgi:DNA-binding NarL/FixJ family response regulator
MATIRVLIADDHPLIREAFEFSIGRFEAAEVVGSVADGNKAVAACASLAPNLVLLDYNMAGGNGSVAAAEIKRRFPQITVVGMSITYSAAKPMNAAGADYFFDKTRVMKELPALLKSLSSEDVGL